MYRTDPSPKAAEHRPPFPRNASSPAMRGSFFARPASLLREFGQQCVPLQQRTIDRGEWHALVQSVSERILRAHEERGHAIGRNARRPEVQAVGGSSAHARHDRQPRRSCVRRLWSPQRRYPPAAGGVTAGIVEHRDLRGSATTSTSLSRTLSTADAGEDPAITEISRIVAAR